MNIIFWTGVFDLNTNYRAIGAYQLAWWMRSHGYKCQVIDFIHHMTSEELISYTEKFITSDTLCIGVSSTFWSQLHGRNKAWPMKRTESVEIPDIIHDALIHLKSRYQKVKFVLGGHTADFIPGECYSLFDASIIGEAEDSFLKLVDSWRDNKSIFHAVTRGGKPFINAEPNKLFDIQKCTHQFTDNDCIIPGEPLPIEISRGCIFKCTFCQYPHIGKTKFDYLRDFDLIKEEIQYNYEKFQTTNYYIVDDTFNDSDFKMQSWYNAVSSLPFKINFTSYLRADLLHRNEQHIDLLRDTGLLSGFFGIESFHPEASRLVGKGWSGKEAKTFLPQLKEKWGNDVTFHLSFIIGLPPEKIADYFQSFNWMVENKMDSWVFKPLLITPGYRMMNSEFDKNYEKYGFEYNPETRGWKTQYMNSAVAIEVGKKLEEKAQGIRKIASWMAISFLGYGVTKEELNTLRSTELDWGKMRALQKQFIANYKNNLGNL